MNKTIEIHDLKKSDLDEIDSAFQKIGWRNRRAMCEAYLQQQSQNLRTVLVAKMNGKFCGYVTIKWQSDYEPFMLNNIPEISDLNVLPDFRRKGIGTLLIQTCEERIKQKGCNTIGIGVGMTADYGSAQRLYVHLGYVPDGHGLHYQNKALNYGDTVRVDDDLVLYFSKPII